MSVGRRLARTGSESTLTLAGGRAVLQAGKDGPVDVVDPATGEVTWSTPAAHLVVRDGWAMVSTGAGAQAGGMKHLMLTF